VYSIIDVVVKVNDFYVADKYTYIYNFETKLMSEMKRLLDILNESTFDRDMHSMNPTQVNDLADEAANLAIKHIQDFLNVQSGDFAGRFFSGQRYDMMVRILSQYIKEELKQPSNQ
jgi:hypothetical protein